MTDLVIRGGTVVTASGSRPADVAVDGGVITAIEPDLSGPAAGAGRVVDATGMLAMYPGGISECEIFFPYGACTTSSKVGQLAANHFASIVPDDGWADRLREVGRRCLWDGAQEIVISEDDGGR